MYLLKHAAVIVTITLLSACGGGAKSTANNNNGTATGEGLVTYWTTNTAIIPLGVVIDGVSVGQLSAATPVGIDPATGKQARPACGSNSATSVSKVLTAGDHTEVLTVNGVAGKATVLTITSGTCLRIQMA